MPRTVELDPHHPDCTYPNGPSMHAGHDPERCCYCAALIRADLFGSKDDPLDYRYGGPGCGCS